MDEESIKALRLAMKKKKAEKKDVVAKTTELSQVVSEAPIQPRMKRTRSETGGDAVVQGGPDQGTAADLDKGKGPLVDPGLEERLRRRWVPDWSIREGDCLVRGRQAVEVADKLATPRDRSDMKSQTLDEAYVRLAQATVLATVQGAHVKGLYEAAVQRERDRADKAEQEVTELKGELEGSRKREAETKVAFDKEKEEWAKARAAQEERSEKEKDEVTKSCQILVINAQDSSYAKALSHVRHFYPTIDLSNFEYDMEIEGTPKTPGGQGSDDKLVTDPPTDPADIEVTAPLPEVDPLRSDVAWLRGKVEALEATLVRYRKRARDTDAAFHYYRNKSEALSEEASRLRRAMVDRELGGVGLGYTMSSSSVQRPSSEKLLRDVIVEKEMEIHRYRTMLGVSTSSSRDRRAEGAPSALPLMERMRSVDAQSSVAGVSTVAEPKDRHDEERVPSRLVGVIPPFAGSEGP